MTRTRRSNSTKRTLVANIIANAAARARASRPGKIPRQVPERSFTKGKPIGDLAEKYEAAAAERDGTSTMPAPPTARPPRALGIALFLAALSAIAACSSKITHVNVYPAFGPHYGDGGG
jgi:hypothetical protein